MSKDYAIAGWRALRAFGDRLRAFGFSESVFAPEAIVSGLISVPFAISI